VLGTLAVASFRESAYSEEDAALLNQIGGQVAIAVQNVLNFGQLQRTEREVVRERDRSRLLLEINNALVSELDLHELVKKISSSLQQVLQHDFVGLALYEIEGGKMIARARDSSGNEIVPFDPQGTTSGLAFATGQPIYLPRPDRERFPSEVTAEFFERGLKTFYSVPVTVHGWKLGVLTLASVREDALSKDARELIDKIAKQVGLAAANALAVGELAAGKISWRKKSSIWKTKSVQNSTSMKSLVTVRPCDKCCKWWRQLRRVTPRYCSWARRAQAKS
jgi:formate hydrogenlyase transcriptional activator